MGRAELTTGRLLPWFAVAYGAGVVLYFTAEREPALSGGGRPDCSLRARRGAAAPANRAAKDRAQCDRARPVRHRFGLCRRDAQDRADPASGAALSGVRRDGRQFCRTARRKPAHRSLCAARRPHRRRPRREEPRRVRLSVKRGTAPAPGSFVEVKASLEPPLQPLEPGSYDFARDLFFQGIGASGFVRGAVKVITAPAPQERAGARRRLRAAPARRDRRPHSRGATGRRRRHRRNANQRPA